MFAKRRNWDYIAEHNVRQAQRLADVMFVYHLYAHKAATRAPKTREQSGSVMHGLVSSASVAWLG